MSNARSPRDVCSTTIGTSAMNYLFDSEKVCLMNLGIGNLCGLARGFGLRFFLRRFFLPFFFADAGVFNQQIKCFAVAQSARDATVAPILCQGSLHLLFRLP